jgi:hypothetical protein
MIWFEALNTAINQDPGHRSIVRITSRDLANGVFILLTWPEPTAKENRTKLRTR